VIVSLYFHLKNLSVLIYNNESPNNIYIICTNASEVAIGAVLEQTMDEKMQRLAFFFRKLSTAEKRYRTYDRELLAIYKALKHLKDQVQGRHLTIKTDHKPLTFALKQKSDKASPRQAR